MKCTCRNAHDLRGRAVLLNSLITINGALYKYGTSMRGLNFVILSMYSVELELTSGIEFIEF